MVNTPARYNVPVPETAAYTKSFAEFFAGIGLMRMGLEQRGWSIAFANDIAPDKLEMYTHHFGDTQEHFVLGDIHKLPADCVPTMTLATASFPCTDLSLAGTRSGLGGKQSSAYWGFVRVIKEMGKRRPPLVLLENVTGFLTSNSGEDFTQALLALNAIGYSVDAFVLDAANFVPQSRQRLFVVGTLRNEDWPQYVKSTRGFYESAIRPKQLADFIFMHPQIDWNIKPLNPPPPASTTLPNILEDLPNEDAHWWSSERALYLLEQMAPRHRALAEQMMAQQQWSYGTVFRRVRNGKSMAELRTDGIAGCLRTPKGGSGRQILFKAGYGNYYVRLLTARECARLMGADDYRLSVPLNQALFGFGDAVCVSVVAWIAENYLNPIVDGLSASKLLISDQETILVNA